MEHHVFEDCFRHIIFTSTYQEWMESLRRITHHYKANNICPMTCLKKQ